MQNNVDILLQRARWQAPAESHEGEGNQDFHVEMAEDKRAKESGRTRGSNFSNLSKMPKKVKSTLGALLFPDTLANKIYRHTLTPL